MATTEHEQEPEAHAGAVPHRWIAVLELLDNIAHVLVAVFFIILSGSVLAYCSLILIRNIQMIGPHSEDLHAPVTAIHPTSPFLHSSLELLSSLLFAVIVLELLKTIITYLKTHNIQAIMKEFLVVGVISSIRKILLVGAETSLASDPTAAYVKEATGTLITIGGILAIIAGLVLLQRSETNAVKGESARPKTE